MAIATGTTVSYTSNAGRVGHYKVLGMWTNPGSGVERVRLTSRPGDTVGFCVDASRVREVPADAGRSMPRILIGEFEALARLLTASRSRGLANPKVRLQTSDGRKVVLSLAGERSRCPGTINVTDGGPYGEGKWFGRVEMDGSFTGNDPQVIEVLRAFAADPAGTARLYGKVTGSCCFCGRALETRESVHVGYGPICAEKYGLPWGETPEGTLAAEVQAAVLAE